MTKICGKLIYNNNIPESEYTDFMNCEIKPQYNFHKPEASGEEILVNTGAIDANIKNLFK